MEKPVMIGAEEVAKRLGKSKTYAYQAIKDMNEEQVKRGRAVVKGRIRSDLFEQRFFPGGDDARL